MFHLGRFLRTVSIGFPVPHFPVAFRRFPENTLKARILSLSATSHNRTNPCENVRAMRPLIASDAVRLAMRLAILAAAILSLVAAPCASGQQVVVADPDFTKVGFEQWVSEGPRTDIPWKLDVSTFGLTVFQRFIARTEIHVGADAISQRAGEGQLLFFVQFTDSRGFSFQSHNHIDLADVKDVHQEALFTQNILAIPGDYRVDFAVYDSASQQRSFAQRTMHIAPLHNDPLPDAWQGADSIEIVPDLNSPDRWYLPRAIDKLHLTVDSQTPVNLQIIASGAWSDELSAEKVLSQIEVPNGSADLALLSYEHRSVFFEQNLAQPLDWPKLKAALATINPNSIDAHSLGGRRENLQFFLDEISRRVAPPNPDSATARDASAIQPLRVFIVLTPPWDFRDGEKVRPIIPDDAHRLVFYLRYSLDHPNDFLPTGAESLNHPPTRHLQSLDRVTPGADFKKLRSTDFLAHTLAPLHPRLFDVTSPEEFRKALATILRDIAKAAQTMNAGNPKGFE